MLRRDLVCARDCFTLSEFYLERHGQVSDSVIPGEGCAEVSKHNRVNFVRQIVDVAKLCTARSYDTGFMDHVMCTCLPRTIRTVAGM